MREWLSSQFSRDEVCRAASTSGSWQIPVQYFDLLRPGFGHGHLLESRAKLCLPDGYVSVPYFILDCQMVSCMCYGVSLSGPPA
jgi:hypothetical protein